MISNQVFWVSFSWSSPNSSACWWGRGYPGLPHLLPTSGNHEVDTLIDLHNWHKPQSEGCAISGPYHATSELVKGSTRTHCQNRTVAPCERRNWSKQQTEEFLSMLTLSYQLRSLPQTPTLDQTFKYHVWPKSVHLQQLLLWIYPGTGYFPIHSE